MHLVHISANPHDPATDGADDDGDTSSANYYN